MRAGVAGRHFCLVREGLKAYSVDTVTDSAEARGLGHMTWEGGHSWPEDPVSVLCL